MSETTGPQSAATLPNLVVAGVARAGTTSLFIYLSQHPEICPADVKEVNYFSGLRFGEPLSPLDSYAQHFRHCRGEPYVMEATPAYFYGGRQVAEAVRDTLPDARIVLTLRDPIPMCWSWFRFNASRARVPRGTTFTQYLDRCEYLLRHGLEESRENLPYRGLDSGCYSDWLGAWTEVFGSDLKIVFFEDLAAQPQRVVTDLCGWLGVDQEVAEGFEYRVENHAEQYRNAALQRVALEVNRRLTPFFLRHRSVKRNLRGLYYLFNRAPDEQVMTEDERARLVEFYRPYNAELVRQLRSAGYERLPAWLHHEPGATDQPGTVSQSGYPTARARESPGR